MIIYLFVQGLSYEVPYNISTMHSVEFGNEMVSFVMISVCIFHLKQPLNIVVTKLNVILTKRIVRIKIHVHKPHLLP